jgi:hypothetical protein
VTAAPTAAHIRAFAIALVATAVAVLVTTGPAAAANKPNCAEQVVADWYDNGRVDYLYPLHCYREAIKSLPPDVKDYSSAKEEIERALQDAANRPPVKVPTRLTPGTGDPTGTGTDPDSETTAGGGGNDDGPDTAGPSSVPIPLIVLGGLSVLLLAAGSAGYLARRFGGGGPGAEGGEPPVA